MSPIDICRPFLPILTIGVENGIIDLYEKYSAVRQKE